MNRRSFITKAIGVFAALAIAPSVSRLREFVQPLAPEIPTFSLRVRHSPLPEPTMFGPRFLHEWQWQWNDGTPESPIFTNYEELERYNDARFGKEIWKPILPKIEGETWDEIENNLAKAYGSNPPRPAMDA